MRHSSFFKALCAGSMLTILAGCTASSGGVPTTGKLIDRVPKNQTYQTAPTLEQTLAPESFKGGIIDDPAVAAYPQQIVDKLLAAWDGTKPSSVTVYLTPVTQFAAEDTSQYDALFLSAGTIGYAQKYWQNSPEAFIFGLAHELAHVLLRHSVVKRSVSTKKNYFFAAEKWASIGAAMAGVGEAKSLLFGGLGGKAALDTLVLSSWTRGQEEAADALAVDLMVRAGYRVDAGPTTMLEAIKASDEDAQKQKDRQEQQQGHMDFNSDDVHLQTKSGDFVGGMMVGMLNGMQVEHPGAEYRGKDLSAYINNNYDDVKPSEHPQKAFQSWVTSRAVTNFLRDTKLLGQVEDDERAKNWSAAKRDLARLGPVGSNSVRGISLEAKADLHTNNVPTAIQKIKILGERDDTTLDMVEYSSDVLTVHHQYKDAEAYLLKKQEAFDNKGLIPYRIQNALASGDSSLQSVATKLIIECQAVGEEELSKQCITASDTKPDNQQKN